MAPNTNFNYRDLKEQLLFLEKANDGYQDYSWEKHLVIQEAKNTMLPPSTSHLKNTPISLGNW